MKTERLEIGQTLALEITTYEKPAGDVRLYGAACFEFTEHSPDFWYSDRETSVDIDAEMARKIIDALNKHFEF